MTVEESTVSLKVPPTHRPYHRPTWSVMRSISDGRWVGVVEGALLQGRLSAGGYWVGDVDSILEHNYVIIDGEGEGGGEVKGCS